MSLLASAPWYGWFFWVFLILGFVLYIRAKNQKEAKKAADRERRVEALRSRLSQMGATSPIELGEFVTGLPGANSGDEIFCGATDSDFVFVRLLGAQVIGQVPRDALTGITVSDQSQVQSHVQTLQRLSVTRMLTLGVFSLAAPKRKTIETTTVTEKYILLISWKGVNEMSEVAQFECSSMMRGNAAATALHDLVLAR